MTEYTIDLDKLTWADMPLIFEGITAENAREYRDMMARAVGIKAEEIPLAHWRQLQKALHAAVVEIPKNG